MPFWHAVVRDAGYIRDMRLRSLILASIGLSLGLSCSDEEDGGEVCTLPDEPRFEVTSTVLLTDSSHESCPADVPTSLNSDDLESQGICGQEISDCVIHLDCEVSGFTVEGRIGERDGNLVGRVEVTKPIKCVYEVAGEFL